MLLYLRFSLPECPFWQTPTHPSKPSLRRNVACGVECLRAAAPVSLLRFLRPVSPSLGERSVLPQPGRSTNPQTHFPLYLWSLFLVQGLEASTGKLMVSVGETVSA